jgi:hypothetical protein
VACHLPFSFLPRGDAARSLSSDSTWIINPKKARIISVLFTILSKDFSTMTGSELGLKILFTYKKIKIKIVSFVKARKKNELRLYLSAMCLSKFRNDMGTILHQGV